MNIKRSAILILLSLIAGALLVAIVAWVRYLGPRERAADEAAEAHSLAVARERDDLQRLRDQFNALSGEPGRPIVAGNEIVSPPKLWLPRLLARPELGEAAKKELLGVERFAAGIDASLSPELRRTLEKGRGYQRGPSGIIADILLFMAPPRAEVLALLESNGIAMPPGCAYESHEMRDVDGDGRQDLLLWQDCRRKKGLDPEYPTDILSAYRLGARPAAKLFDSPPLFRSDEDQIGRHRGSPAPQLLLRGEDFFTVYEFGPGGLRELAVYNRTGPGGRQGLSFSAAWRDRDGDGSDELTVKEFSPGSRVRLEDNDEGFWDDSSRWNPIAVFKFREDGTMSRDPALTKAATESVLKDELGQPRTKTSRMNAAICYRALGQNDKAQALLKEGSPAH